MRMCICVLWSRWRSEEHSWVGASSPCQSWALCSVINLAGKRLHPPFLSLVLSIAFLGMSSLNAHTRQVLCCWAISPSWCSSGWPGPCAIAKDDLDIQILLLLSSPPPQQNSHMGLWSHIAQVLFVLCKGLNLGSHTHYASALPSFIALQIL